MGKEPARGCIGLRLLLRTPKVQQRRNTDDDGQHNQAHSSSVGMVLGNKITDTSNLTSSRGSSALLHSKIAARLAQWPEGLRGMESNHRPLAG
jgi:hypothetical protein